MIKTFAEAEQVLAARLPGYTERPQQQALAAFVEKIISEGGHGLAEAGCGTGKSLATMIPAILGGRKTVVATATKALMEQYANKDVPFLEEHLGVPFTWALVKGRSNYLCMARATDTDTAAKVPALARIMKEVEDNPEHSGDFEHFDVEVTDRDKFFLASTADTCPGKSNCPFGEVCFAEKAKKAGREAQVVITNTAMLMTDLLVREMTDGEAMMLGDYELVLIDEAHETEDYATNALQSEIKHNGVLMLTAEAANFARSQGQGITMDQVVVAALNECWDLLDEGQKTLRFFVDNAEPFMDLIDALRDFADEVSKIEARNIKEEAKRNRIVKRAKNYADKFATAITADDELMVRWIETKTDNRGNQVKTFNLAPIHVGSFLGSWLWDNTSAVLISATLSVGGDFGYISNRLGLPSTTQALSVGTPFDYSTQALLFVPPANAPSPKDRNGWLGYSATMTQELVAAAGGGALLLFTSRSAMEAAYNNLRETFERQGLTCLMQGQGSNRELAQRFTDDTHSVLFALKSFMTGVDFQGDTCRLVVIDKLPFPVPTEPVFAARANQVERHGGNSFSALTIPMMTLTLEQAYGRLIRTSADRGVVAILDSRLSSTGYGKKIVNGLPASPRTTALADVQRFFAKGEGV